MTLLEALQGASTTVAVGSRLLNEVRVLWKSMEQRLRPGPTVAYENLLLELVYDIQDRHGMRAILERRQHVRFLADDSDIVRELVWGDGEQMARYDVHGARRMLVRPPGQPKQHGAL